MDKQHNWRLSRIADGEEAARQIDDKTAAVRDVWFRVGHAFLAAKDEFPSTQAYGEWLRSSPLARVSPDDRSRVMRLAQMEEIAKTILEGTDVASPKRMLERVLDVLRVARSSSLDTSKLDPHPPEDEKITEIAETSEGNGSSSLPETEATRSPISPRKPGRPGDIEKLIGDDAAYIRAWYTEAGTNKLSDCIREIKEHKPLLLAVAACVKSGECVHAAVAGGRHFDIRMAFPHIPEALAKAVGRERTWKSMRSKHKGGTSDWERFSDLNDLCKGKSIYSVEKPAPNGTYRLRESKHEDEIGQAARQWWQSGHWPGERPKLQVHTNETASQENTAHAPTGEAIYFGMVLWPIPPSSWRGADDPSIPTKQDLDNTYWFVEELHRAMVAQGLSHSATARYIRNWSKYIGQLQKPTAAAAVMQDMAQGIDMHGRHPEQQLDLKNKIPGRPTKFAAER